MISILTKHRRLLALVLLVSACGPRAVLACSTCFGDPSSEMVEGAKAGVIVLAVVVYGVVFSMVGVVGVWTFRARKLANAHDPAAVRDPSL